MFHLPQAEYTLKEHLEWTQMKVRHYKFHMQSSLNCGPLNVDVCSIMCLKKKDYKLTLKPFVIDHNHDF